MPCCAKQCLPPKRAWIARQSELGSRRAQRIADDEHERTVFATFTVSSGSSSTLTGEGASAAHGLLDLVDGLGHGAAEHFASGGRDEHVVLDADAAHVGKAPELLAVERALELPHFLGSLQDAPDLVEAGLDRDAHASSQVAIETEVTVAGQS